jgi:hypothetical protein
MRERRRGRLWWRDSRTSRETRSSDGTDQSTASKSMVVTGEREETRERQQGADLDKNLSEGLILSGGLNEGLIINKRL